MALRLQQRAKAGQEDMLSAGRGVFEKSIRDLAETRGAAGGQVGEEGVQVLHGDVSAQDIGRRLEDQGGCHVWKA